MQRTENNHYATLGLHRRCTASQIRDAYRLLAKKYHPDLNPGSREAVTRTQQLNAAYEILSDPDHRRDYDNELAADETSAAPKRSGKFERNVSQDANMRLEEFLRGAKLEVRIKDPGNPNGVETYELIVPPNTAPGTRFRVPRDEPFAGGFVQLRVKPLPHFRFKPRGSDLRCDLKIRLDRATQGGIEMVPGLNGGMLRVQIPRGVGRNEIIRISGEGLPKARGGRGDLLVRIVYRPEVKVRTVRGR